LKIAQGIQYTPLRGIYIPHLDQISVKKFSLEVVYPSRGTDGVKFDMEKGTLLHANLPLSVLRVYGAKTLKIGL